MSKTVFSFSSDIVKKLDSIVSVNTSVPAGSFSAELLGTERAGHGIVIREDGLIITIGYVLTEAELIWIGTGESTMVPGYIVANDYETGLGLVKPVMPIDFPAMEIGYINKLNEGDSVLIAGHGGSAYMIESRVIAKDEFAGRWEYMLDEAVYTSPPHPDWAGAALMGVDGKLYGVGCLLLQDGKSGELISGTNLFVPVDILLPDLEELCEFGGRRKPPRPWLGLLLQEELNELIITGIFSGCPADRAGLRPGDVIVSLNGKPVSGLSGFFRSVWDMGNAGVGIPLTILREEAQLDIVVKSGDRESSLRRGTIN